MRITLLGYLFQGNVGDDIILLSFVKRLKEAAEAKLISPIEQLAVIGGDRRFGLPIEYEWIQKGALGRARQAISNSDALILPGGSLLQDRTSARSLYYYLYLIRHGVRSKRTKVIFLSQGIGPIKKINFPLVRSVLDGCDYISTRDRDSANFLKQTLKISKEVHLGADASFLTAPEDHLAESNNDKTESDTLENSSHESITVGISIKGGKDEERTANLWAEVACQIAARFGAAVRIFPMSAEDTSASERTVWASKEIAERGNLVISTARSEEPASRSAIADALIKEEIGSDMEHQPILTPSVPVSLAFEGSPTVEKVLKTFRKIDILVGFRLHSLILANQFGLPYIGVAYDPKVESFCRETEAPSLLEFTEKVWIILDYIQNILNYHQGTVAGVTKKREEMRERSEEDFKRALSILT